MEEWENGRESEGKRKSRVKVQLNWKFRWVQRGRLQLWVQLVLVGWQRK